MRFVFAISILLVVVMNGSARPIAIDYCIDPVSADSGSASCGKQFFYLIDGVRVERQILYTDSIASDSLHIEIITSGGLPGVYGDIPPPYYGLRKQVVLDADDNYMPVSSPGIDEFMANVNESSMLLYRNHVCLLSKPLVREPFLICD